MHKYSSNSIEINRKNERNKFIDDSEIDLEDDDFFFPKQASPKKKISTTPKKSSLGKSLHEKDQAIDLMCKSLSQKYGSMDSYASSYSSTVTDTSIDSTEDDVPGDVIGNLMSTSTMSGSSWKRDTVDPFSTLSPPKMDLKPHSLPTKGFAKKPSTLFTEKKKKDWFKKPVHSDDEDSDDAATDSGDEGLDASPRSHKDFSIEIPRAPQGTTTFDVPPSTPASAPKSTFDNMTAPDEKEEKKDKKSALTVFLLQHVCRQYNPDPAFFEKMCKQLYETGYLDDDRFLTLEQLKQSCKSIMVDVIKNWPINMESSQLGLTRSESLGSFMHTKQSESALVPGGNKTLSSHLPFFDYMFYSQSRFRSDFLSKNLIGKGAFGVVYQSRHRIDGAEYALKKVKFSFRNAAELERAYTRVIREVQSLAALDHTNIVRYNQAWFEPCRKDMQQDFADTPLEEPSYATMKESSNGLQFEYSNDSVGISIDNDPTDIFDTKPIYTDPKKLVSPTTELPPSPVNMSYLEYALKNKSPKSPKKEESPIGSVGYGSEMRNIFDQMFNEENSKFEMLLFIQMQLCQQHTLEDWLWSEERVKHQTVDMTAVNSYFKQIVHAIAHVHDKNLIHRDLKPPNIFLSSDGHVKIGDFGLAKFVNETISTPKVNLAVAVVDNSRTPPFYSSSHSSNSSSSHTSGVGTYLYASPEQLADSLYDAKSDIFSLGVILFEMLHPVSTKSERAIVLSDLRRGVVPERMLKLYPKQMDLVKRCVCEQVASRPSAQEILAIVHSFDEGQTPCSIVDEKRKMQEQLIAQQEMIMKLQQELAALKMGANAK